MMFIGTVLRTLLSRFLLCVVMVICFIPFLFFIMIPERWRYNSKILYSIVYAFYWVVIKISLLPVKFKGIRHIPKKAVIFVANHQSSLDIPLLGVLARGRPHIWLALSYLMKSPILRFVLPRTAVLVDVSSARRAVRSLTHTIDLVENKDCDVMIFPEGGRYTDGTVHEFFRGFVILAKKLRRPVIPVRIFGVNKVYPPHSFWVHWHKIRVVVGEPLVYLANDTDETFKNRVYEWFVAQGES